MNPDWLLKHFDQVSEAPDAVPRLRRFILDLAIRGNLVEQDPMDEPASELVKRIENEVNKAVAITSFSADIDPPFEIPNSWVWVQIGSIVYVEMGQSPPSEYYNQSGDGLPFYQGKADFGKRNPAPRYWCSQPTKLAKKDDILISVRAPVGPTNVASEECCIGRGLAAIRPHKGVDLELFLYWLQGFELKIAEMGFGTTFIAINKKQLVSFLLPLPPLAEQQRIVAKVDELMALCDELEAAQTKREKRRDRLVAATLHGLNNGDESAEPGIHLAFEESVRFYFNHLPRLTTRPEHIQQLRQTILNLAVRGKLVPQDPSDGSGSDALDSAHKEKELLLLERNIRREKDVEYSMPDDFVGIPNSWIWAYVNDVAIVQGGKRLPKGATFAKVPTPHIYIRVTDMKNGTILDDDLQYITPGVQRTIARYTINQGDLYITIAGTIGQVGRVPAFFDGHNLTENAAKLVFRGLNPEYFSLALSADSVQQQFRDKTKQMAQPKLALKRIAGAKFPLPPLTEQHRIVAKVDELMALCNELESRITKTATTRRQLLDAALYEALNLHSGIQ